MTTKDNGYCMLGFQFIGREDELQKLHDLTIQGIDHHGSILFIEATTGMGTSTLLREFNERTQKDQQLDGTEFIFVECDRFSGTEDAYYPFVEILDSFEKPKLKRKEIGQKAIKIITESAPDWLDILPVIGPTIKAVVKTAAKASGIALTSGSNTQADKGIRLTNQYVKTIQEIGSNCKLLVLIISRAQWIDKASCQLLLRLGYAIQDHNLVIILTYNPEYADDNSLLKNILTEMHERKIAEKVTLRGWSLENISSYLKTAFGELLNPSLAKWLQYLYDGHPLFITQCLNLLRENNIIEYSDSRYKLNGQIKVDISGKWEVDFRIKEVLRSKDRDYLLLERLKSLQKEEQQILQLGAVHGSNFMTVVLERILSKPKHEIIRHLLQIEEQHQIISCSTDEESLKIRSDVYAFVQNHMQECIYNRLPPAYRSHIHQEIAKILDEILNDALKKNPLMIPRRKLMIDIAKHYDWGDEPLPAARYYFQAAQSTFYNGALKETLVLCQKALEKIRSLPQGEIEYDKLHAEIIELKLTASWWQGRPESGEETLIEEAEVSASHYSSVSRDWALLARIKYLKGRIFVHTRNLGDAIEVLKEALKIAQDARDSLTQFIIMSELGHLIVGNRGTDINMNFEFGLKLQHNAYDLFVENNLSSQVQPDMLADLNVYLYRCMTRIGIGEFDGGNYGEAIKWILESIKGLKEIERIEDLSRSLYFLGQVYTAIGLFEDAENALCEAIDLYKNEEGSIYLRDNNKAFLGKLYIEWGRIAKAEKPLKEGWKGFYDAWSADMAAVVNNYYTELLMHPEYKGESKSPLIITRRLENLHKAKDLLWKTIKEVKKTKFYRSEIVALSLLGKLAIIEGDLESAIKHSTQAVQYLEKMGTMPLVRMEEVFFNHYCILKTVENPDAKKYLYRAYEILQQKADSLNQEQKHKFLDRVLLSRNILSEFNCLSEKNIIR
jgi:tetratricopeptide (TPR) repeat protein